MRTLFFTTSTSSSIQLLNVIVNSIDQINRKPYATWTNEKVTRNALLKQLFQSEAKLIFGDLWPCSLSNCSCFIFICIFPSYLVSSFSSSYSIAMAMAKLTWNLVKSNAKTWVTYSTRQVKWIVVKWNIFSNTQEKKTNQLVKPISRCKVFSSLFQTSFSLSLSLLCAEVRKSNKK